MHKPIIRPAQTADATQIGDIGYAAWIKGIGSHLQRADKIKVSPGVFVSFAQSHTDQILVAEIADRVVGFTATENADNYISDLWVAPDHEGHGIGTKLLCTIEGVVGKRGFGSVELEVLTSNVRALNFYERLGYRHIWQGLRTEKVFQNALHKTRLAKYIE